MIIHRMTEPLSGAARLAHLGVIRVTGEDAVSFLQGQLTQDFALLRDDQTRLAAFCSAKGRMQASFVGWRRSPTEVLLVCSLDLLPAVLKRLSMFVLRAKARLTDATADFALWGLAGTAAQALGGADAPPWSRFAVGAADAVRLYPAEGQARALWLAPADAPGPQAEALSPAAWLWGEVRSGVATVTAPIVDAFVPQMLNYESVGGVSFKKGCYPGQEVVARSQFRGTLKRRAFLARCAAGMSAGQEVFQAGGDGQPVGLVAQAAADPAGGWAAIVAIQTAAATADLRLGTQDGPALTLDALPYTLLDDI
jgi:folate-binding protein YgfZ